jgi:hypothetical protein
MRVIHHLFKDLGAWIIIGVLSSPLEILIGGSLFLSIYMFTLRLPL